MVKASQRRKPLKDPLLTVSVRPERAISFQRRQRRQPPLLEQPASIG